MSKAVGVARRIISRIKHLWERSEGKVRNVRSLVGDRKHARALRRQTDFLLRGRKKRGLHEMAIGSYFDARFRVLRQTKRRLKELLKEMGAGYWDYSIYTRVKTTESQLNKIARRMKYFEENLKKVPGAEAAGVKGGLFEVTRDDIMKMAEPSKRPGTIHFAFNERLFRHIVKSMGYKLPDGYNKQPNLKSRLKLFFREHPGFNLRISWKQLLLISSEDVLREKMGLRVVLRPPLRGYVKDLPVDPKFVVFEKSTPLSPEQRKAAKSRGSRFTMEAQDRRGKLRTVSFSRVDMPEGKKNVTTVLFDRKALDECPQIRESLSKEGYRDNPDEAFLISKIMELQRAIRNGQLALDPRLRNRDMGHTFHRRNAIAHPEKRGVRSLILSVKVAKEGPPVEIQLRTEDMNRHVRIVDKTHGPWARTKGGQVMTLKERRRYTRFLDELDETELDFSDLGEEDLL